MSVLPRSHVSDGLCLQCSQPLMIDTYVQNYFGASKMVNSTALFSFISWVYFFLFFFFKVLFIFRGKGGRKRGRTTSMCGYLSCAPYWGTWPTTQACALTGNQTSNPLLRRPILSPLIYTNLGTLGGYISMKRSSSAIWLPSCRGMILSFHLTVSKIKSWFTKSSSDDQFDCTLFIYFCIIRDFIAVTILIEAQIEVLS